MNELTFDAANLAFVGVVQEQNFDAWAARSADAQALDIMVDGVLFTRDTGDGQRPVRASWRAHRLGSRMVSALLVGYKAPPVTRLVPCTADEMRAAYREFMAAAGRLGAYWAAHGALNVNMNWNSESWRIIGDVPHDERAAELLEDAQAELRAFARRYLYRQGLGADAEMGYRRSVEALGALA